MSPFLVETRLVSLAVITAGGALKTIRLGALAPRPPDPYLAEAPDITAGIPRS